MSFLGRYTDSGFVLDDSAVFNSGSNSPTIKQRLNMLTDTDYMDDKGGYYELVCIAKMDSDSSLMAVYVNKQTYEYCVCPASEFEKKFKPVP